MSISIERFEDHTISNGVGYDKKDRTHRYFRYEWYYNGQWVIVDIDCDTPADSAAKARWWNIGLTISDDYREEALNKCHKEKLITGRMGAKGLLFAKAAIQDFEQSIQMLYPEHRHFLYCGWLDGVAAEHMLML